jgi:DNA polymerase elongation subunit (family B)
MDKYYGKKSSDKLESTIDFQIIEWWAKDETSASDNSDDDSDGGEEKLTYAIYCFGRTDTGKSITVKINNYNPFYYIKIPGNCSSGYLSLFLEFVKSKLYRNADGLNEDLCEIVKKKDLFGFRNDKYYNYIKLAFKNISTMNKSKYIFKNPVIIQGINSQPMKYKLYESNFEPFLRFCHIKNVQMANWVRIKNFKVNSSLAKTDISIEINQAKHKNSIVPIENNTIASYLQASWDIEVYSYDGEFPDPKKKNSKGEYPNVIYQMATTFKYFNDKNILVKHLLSLKKCAPIIGSETEPVVVECFSTEKDLIKRWIDLMKQMDPDIIYTYNGDSFDWMYLTQRCELLGLKDYLFSNISRLNTFNAEIKKEFFSSSAYGDNEYNRVYIPGRLNYDLMIHYKRGMKKYSSYKLDSIASEILNENKHEVSVKEIFEYYRDGCPDKLKCIGLYCIQDTHLLQKLVDKQMILITIIQLANVTFVPIGYLVTRGQTIKVSSQILRKARQMDYLVPNTNFNEDNYPIKIKLKSGIDSDVFKVGDFLKLGIKATKSANSYSGNDQLNCKISEIVDESHVILLTSIELSQPHYNIKLFYKGSSMVVEKVWSVNELIDDTFTGACVLEPLIGFTNDDVVVLDFASLYPTIIISRNLCYSTFVMDDQFRDCKDVNYETIEWSDSVEYKLNHKCGALMKTGKKKNETCDKQAYFDVNENYFCRVHDPLKKSRDANEKYQKKHIECSYTVVQPSYDENGNIRHKGVLPALLEELYAERKAVKKRMAIAYEKGDKLLAEILECTQLSIKISLNSCYGFLGRKQGNMVLKELGSIVTAVGRQLIETSRDFAENEFLEYVKDNKIITQKVIPKTYNYTTEQKDQLLNSYLIK